MDRSIDKVKGKHKVKPWNTEIFNINDLRRNEKRER